MIAQGHSLICVDPLITLYFIAFFCCDMAERIIACLELEGIILCKYIKESDFIIAYLQVMEHRNHYTEIFILNPCSLFHDDKQQSKNLVNKVFSDLTASINSLGDSLDKIVVLIDGIHLLCPFTLRASSGTSSRAVDISSEFLLALSSFYNNLSTKAVILCFSPSCQGLNPEFLKLVSSTINMQGYNLSSRIGFHIKERNLDGSVIDASLPMKLTARAASSLPSLSWDTVGGYDDVKLALVSAIAWPQKYPDTIKRLGIQPCKGILLHGPPGNSKTSLARICASQSGHAVFIINAAELYSCYLGESERKLRDLFKQARDAAPAILFLDEIDALVGSRSIGNNSKFQDVSAGGSGPSNKDPVQERVLSTLLNELDGIESLHGVIVIGATNRIDKIDDALLRPGRFDKLIYVGKPDYDARKCILALYLESLRPVLDTTDVDRLIDTYSRLSEGFSGADCMRLVQEAAMIAMRRCLLPKDEREKLLLTDINITEEDFSRAYEVCR